MLERRINESLSSSFDNDDNLTLKTKKNNLFNNFGDVLIAMGEACWAAADRYEEVRENQKLSYTEVSLSNFGESKIKTGAACWKKATEEMAKS